MNKISSHILLNDTMMRVRKDNKENKVKPKIKNRMSSYLHFSIFCVLMPKRGIESFRNGLWLGSFFAKVSSLCII